MHREGKKGKMMHREGKKGKMMTHKEGKKGEGGGWGSGRREGDV